MTDHHLAIAEQMEYYRLRASEYDQWFLRQGRYDRGPEYNRLWFQEVEAVRAELDRARPNGDVLELACGTGIWTERLLRHAERATAVDASEEMLRINGARTRSDRVAYCRADVFQWVPDRAFDFIFFGFWLSHVPPERFDSFWALVRSSLRPGGRVFFVDSRREPTSTARDHVLPDEAQTTLTRRLNDGREFRIVKVFYEARALQGRLDGLGWDVRVGRTEHYFIYGTGSVRRSEPES